MAERGPPPPAPLIGGWCRAGADGRVGGVTPRARWTLLAALVALAGAAFAVAISVRPDGRTAGSSPGSLRAAAAAAARADTVGVPAGAPFAMTFGSATTLRPDRARPSGGRRHAELAAAANESASFQVDLRTADRPVTVSAAAPIGALTGPGGATIPRSAISVAREATYTVVQESDGEGERGLWPDRLVPDRDPLLHGDGGAFPLRLGPGSAGALWVDVAVPRRAAPGRYTGTLRIRRSGGSRLADVPIRLTVRPFALPSTSSLRSIFLINPWDVCAPRPGYTGAYVELARADRSGCDPAKEGSWRVFRRFAQLGLRNRITIANPYPTPQMRAPGRAPVVPDPARPGAPRTTAEAFTAYVKPLLDGHGGLGVLPGARLTALTTQWNCILDPGRGRDCLADWRRFMATHAADAAPRFLPWVCDEPQFSGDAHQTPWGRLIGWQMTRQHAPCESLRARARAGWPHVPVKITTPIDDPGLYPDGAVDPSKLGSDAVDVLTPDVTSLVTRTRGSTRSRYEAFVRRPGTELWLYLACPTAGCDPGRTDPKAVRDPAYAGWPSYSIDQPASQASAMGWMAFLYGVSGESYFDTTSGFGEGPGFQHGIEGFGSNGDGQLFYPGRVRVRHRSGTVTELLPFESIRLKRIREGREDYEYLRLLEACGRRSDALAVVERLYGDPDQAMFQTTVSQAQLDGARAELAELIVRNRCGDQRAVPRPAR